MLLRVGNRIDGRKEQLYLTTSDLKAHAHGIGASRAGKSKLIEFVARQLIKERQGFCLIDPGGFLYHDLVQWLAYVKPKRDDIFLFNPSDEKKVVGFNPFHLHGTKNEATITAKVDRILASTLKAWGMSDTSNAPRMERVMRCIYYTLIEQDLPIAAVRFFLSPRHIHQRDEIINRIQSETIKDQWLMLTANKRPESYLNMVESTANRLFKFLTQQTVKRIIGSSENALDIQKIVDSRGTLLVNLQSGATFSQESSRIIGTLLVNEIWETVRKRTREDMRKLPTFFLIVDEFQSFATPDFGQMLDQAAKYGLHQVLFHQNLNQLDADLRTALTACHTRFVFGGVTRADASYMLEGSIPTIDNLQDDISSVPSLPARYYLLKRPDQRLAYAFTPTVEEYRVPEQKVELYVDRVTAGFMTPAEVDRLLDKSIESPQSGEPENGEGTAPSVDLGQVLTERSPNEPKSRDKPLFSLSYDRARGTPVHRETQSQIAGAASTLGFKARIEQPVLDGAGSVDVSLEKGRMKIACEVSITSTAAWETKNVLKCLKAGYNQVWVIAFPKSISGLMATIRKTIPISEQFRVKVLSLGECFVELRKLASPVDSKTGKPVPLDEGRATIPEAAEFFRVHESTIRRWKAEGKLPYIQIGRQIFFEWAVLRLIGRHTLTAKQRTKINLDKPVKLEKPQSKSKKQEHERFRKLMKLD